MKNIAGLFLLLTFLFLNSLPVSAREYSSEEKLSQMFILGFRGTAIKDFREFSGNNFWGGYIFYSIYDEKDPINILSSKQIKKLLAEIKGSLEDTVIKPFLAVDMEGGLMQIGKKGNENFPFFESPKKIAAEDRERINNWAQAIAENMKDLGFNLNLAPVVDVDKYPFKNSRCFSSTPDVVIKDSKLFIARHKENGIICTLKHFPGRGGGRAKDFTENYAEAIDLKPFKELIKNGDVSVIMISTNLFPALDPFNNAYKSSKIIGTLRETGYSKVIMTDDVSYFVSNNITAEALEEEIVAVIQAGNDLLLFTNTGKNYDPEFSRKLSSAVKNIIKKKRIPENRIEESFRRILELKQEKNINPEEIYLDYVI